MVNCFEPSFLEKGFHLKIRNWKKDFKRKAEIIEETGKDDPKRVIFLELDGHFITETPITFENLQQNQDS